MSTVPIADYALLSDCHSASLVNRAGSIDWLCFPRFDSPAVFARLLDEHGGHWSISVNGAPQVSRRYYKGTMVLETTMRTPTGCAVLLEAMAVGRNERGHDLGVGSPGIVLRSLVCESGMVDITIEYAPRFEYGLIFPLLRPIAGGILARGGADVMVLSTAEAFSIDGSIARAHATLRAGERMNFALQHQMCWESRAQVYSQVEISSRLQDTLEGWQTWSAHHQNYKGPWCEQVNHSGCVLQALTFRPTGAIVAAATTSLPEAVGEGRNWDYRYTWIRDASLTLQALWIAACPDEARLFFSWMAGAAADQVRRGDMLQIMFGVGGEHDLSERSLPHLEGWRNSRPVRIGNGAWEQVQLDVYGELLCAVRRLREQVGELDAISRAFLVDVADAAAAHWQERDHSIWEVREAPQDFLYSKLMCWLALDCAIDLADILGAEERIEAWKKMRQEIRDAILTRGWSEQAGAFTQTFGSHDLDASALMMPIIGFLPATDLRIRSTIDAIAERLIDEHGLVYRYRVADGLGGSEGTFLLCTFWLAHAQALAGDVGQARKTFEQALSYANDVGLLSEEVDPVSNELLGNFPQAFSHIGLINAAWAISQA